MPDTTILLPNYNNEYCLPVTFEYLRKNIDCSRVHFVMVDDGSEDNGVSVAKVEAARCGFASVEIIERGHEGIVPTLNAGLAAVKTPYTIRIDGDATVETPDWARMLVEVLKHPEVGAVGGCVLFEHGAVHTFGRSIFSEWGLYDMGSCPLEPPGRRTFDSVVFRPARGFPDCPPYEADAILGICVAFRTEEARLAGGFDMKFNPVWIEDDDFALALRQLGRRVIVLPSVKIIHRQSLRGSRMPGQPKRSAAATDSVSRRLIRQARRKMRPLGRAMRALRRGEEKPAGIESLLPSEPDPWRRNILLGHYATWKAKWGFDLINPDLLSIYDRYWETAFCWQRNPSQLERSRAFLRKL